MKHFTKLLTLGLVALAIVSCGTASNSVNSGGLIQKRKYTKGFYWNHAKHVRGAGEDVSAAPLDETETTIVLNERNTRPSELISEGSISENIAEAPVVTTEAWVEQAPVTETDVPETPRRHTAARHKDADEQTVGEAMIQPVRGHAMRERHQNAADSGEGAVMLLLLIIFAIILPPLAVVLYEGFTGRFWLDLIFWLLGISSGLIIAPWAFVFLVVAIVYALIIVLGG